MCLINTNILRYRYARCNYKLWKVLWFHSNFGYFGYFFSCLNCYISTKLSQIVCLIDVHILVYQHAKCGCTLWQVIWFNYFFFGKIYIITCFTNCVLRQKCNLLWLRQSSLYISIISLLKSLNDIKLIIYEFNTSLWQLQCDNNFKYGAKYVIILFYYTLYSKFSLQEVACLYK